MNTGRKSYPGRPQGAAAQERATELAILALTFMAAEPERLNGFLAVSGIGLDSLRAAASEPDFLAGVLDHLLADEAMLIAFAEEQGLDPAAIGRARAALGSPWEQDAP